MPGQGRIKGSKNKKTKELEQLLAEALGPDWCPVVKMAQIAETGMINVPGSDVEMKPVSDDIRMTAIREVSQYVRPKRKAIEHAGANGGALEVVISKAEAEL